MRPDLSDSRSDISSLVHISVDSRHLTGALEMPSGARGVVLFAHGSGSSRLSPRNNFVAAELRKAGLTTLLIDLLTPEEDRDYRRRFDIELLTDRLGAAAHWLATQARTRDCGLGLFGASTGAAAALRLAATSAEVRAVVSRGGRPDLAEPSALRSVVAPTLLIVGGLDDTVIELNRSDYAELTCARRLEIVPGATHLFEEPGTLEQVARLATDWFCRHLPQTKKAMPSA